MRVDFSRNNPNIEDPVTDPGTNPSIDMPPGGGSDPDVYPIPLPPDQDPPAPIEEPPDQPGKPENEPNPPPMGDPKPNEPTRLV